ncbi:transcriptional regulator family: Fungal Specific TF [Paecilomyces variotii]|nr:transcriptional regulator family: Fungal Specific TF [Paecilomyces variotii]
MKRKSELENLTNSQDSDTRQSSRQEPLSCQNCRSRKIKCDRQRPCFNCVTRDLACLYVTKSNHPNHGQTDAREEKETTDSAVARDVRSSTAARDELTMADWLEKIVMSPRVPDALPLGLKDKLIAMQRDCQRLNASTPGGPRNNDGDASWIGSKPDTGLGIANLVALLPPKTEVVGLLRYYVDYINYLYHIIVPDRTELQVNRIYECIDNGSPVNMSHMALLFSILAVALYFQLQNSSEPPDHVEKRCQEFSFLVGASLIQANYVAYPDIEGLQATIIIAHHFSNIDIDPSVRGFFVLEAMIGQARSLSLHCTDLPRFKEERRHNRPDWVVVEIKRRLWWHLTAYDWFLSFLSGPQERTYIIHPRHMNVQHPSNLDDDEIGSEESVDEKPSSVPTIMSYTLARLELAVVCREFADATVDDHFQGLEISYDKILQLDRKIHEAYQRLPEFFLFDLTNRQRFNNLYKQRPTIAWQRCLIQQGYYSRLCRLHRQYFIRGARDPLLSYSHVLCLESARKVIQIKRIMDEEEPSFKPNSSVVWSIVHHVFMAAVILLMDVCFNWDDIMGDRRREEVLDACRMLSKAQQSSSVVREGISAMMDILRKHWYHDKDKSRAIGFPASDQSPSGPAIAASRETEGLRVLPSHKPGFSDICFIGSVAPLSNPANAVANGGDRQLEDIWSELLDQGGNFVSEPPEWMDLLTELTNVAGPSSN